MVTDTGPKTTTFCLSENHVFTRSDLGASTVQVYCVNCPYSVTLTTKLSWVDYMHAAQRAREFTERGR